MKMDYTENLKSSSEHHKLWGLLNNCPISIVEPYVGARTPQAAFFNNSGLEMDQSEEWPIGSREHFDFDMRTEIIATDS